MPLGKKKKNKKRNVVYWKMFIKLSFFTLNFFYYVASSQTTPYIIHDTFIYTYTRLQPNGEWDKNDKLLFFQNRHVFKTFFYWNFLIRVENVKETFSGLRQHTGKKASLKNGSILSLPSSGGRK